MADSPLPGGVSAVFRTLFSLPQWIQVSALALGLAASGAVLIALWLRRGALWNWLRSRSRGVTIALVTGAALAVAGSAAAGAWGWRYSQHDNGFCVSCHVMGPSFERFTKSQHASRECHDCHQQSIFASMRQLYLWVAERPEEIGEHAKVPNEVCASCHVTGDPEKWQRIASTAGHRVHLESDSSALRGLQCVTCHGVEVHQFAPVNRTCGQAGCHPSAATGIALAKMADQTALHCVACHRFTEEVPALATRDSASGTLRPGEQQCMACHRMQAAMANFDSAKDPHLGTCGMCHNPHQQRLAADAAKTCATAECHAGWRDEPFHTGVRHRDVGTQCTVCHEPHAARVDASDCAGCHQRANPGRARPLPVPFDTSRALRQGAFLPDHEWLVPRGKSVRPRPGGTPRWMLLAQQVTPADTFSHERHKELSCITCHPSDRAHGRLSFEPPRGCQICHHQAPARADCTTCHQAGELMASLDVSVRVTVGDSPPRTHAAVFAHETHRVLSCTTCHTTPVTLAPEPAIAQCASCHQDHHASGRTCSTCHSGEGFLAAHRPALTTHTGCDNCHSRETVELLMPARSMCLTCHSEQRDHYAGRECSTCHFQASPESFRRHLSSGARRP
jgi:hypothetical protein